MTKQIVDIHSIEEVPRFLEDETHIFLDIDNTLMTTISEFGSEPWERFMIEHFILEGVGEKEAIARASGLWKAIQTVSEIQLVEPKTLEIFRALQKRGKPIFAITARDPEFLSVTEEQLAHLGFSFSQCNAPFPLEPAAYHNGVFYCGFVPKGTVLKWYATLSRAPHLLLVDDYKVHLDKAAQILDTPFTGLRYGYLDARKSNYTPCEITKLLGKVFTHPQASHFLRYGMHTVSP